MMTSSRPYLIRAVYEWLVDNQLTPYLMVDANIPHVSVPKRFIEDGKIILNISPQAVLHLSMTNEFIEFDASFSGLTQHIYIPVVAILAIYAYENGRGMMFQEDEVGDQGGEGKGGPEPPRPPRKKGRPDLKVVK